MRLVFLFLTGFVALGVAKPTYDYTGPQTPPPVDEAREHRRAESAQQSAAPRADRLTRSGQVIWMQGQLTPAQIVVGETLTLSGSGFGGGPDVDFSKLLVGTSRALERDLVMFTGTVNFLKQLFFEKVTPFDGWTKDILSWTDTQIIFTVPLSASRGPLVVSVQKRTGANASPFHPSAPFAIWDPLSERVRGNFAHRYDVVSTLGPAVLSQAIPVDVINESFSQNVALGEAIYWSYDYNLGLVHALKGMDWNQVLAGESLDPLTHQRADPEVAFGALRLIVGEVPAVAAAAVTFDPYPMPMPIKPLLRRPLLKGTTRPTGFVGYVSAESIHPVTEKKGSWVGFNCASCHAQRITYESAPGVTVTRVFPGLPNPHWSMKWAVLGNLRGIKTKGLDKSLVIYSVPLGTGEHSLVRPANDGSPYADDHQFSPVAIPIITRHTPVRRSLSHTELVAGFEGSYIHAQEPDGGLGAMHAAPLRALTAYMTTLDASAATLERVGLHRWLKQNGLLAEVDNHSEGEFVQRGKEFFPRLTSRIERGRAAFQRDCQSCHQNNFGTWTEENMRPISEVGSYFSPTIFQKKNQSIRTAMLRNLFWVQPRGLLHDGHVKSLEDLLAPERCDSGSALYRKYYSIHEGSFKIPKGTPDQERALRQQANFVDVAWDKDNLYWDYQANRRLFSMRPASPHPWCASDPQTVTDLVAFLLTL